MDEDRTMMDELLREYAKRSDEATARRLVDEHAAMRVERDTARAELDELRQRAREVRDDYGRLSTMTTWDVARYILGESR